MKSKVTYAIVVLALLLVVGLLEHFIVGDQPLVCRCADKLSTACDKRTDCEPVLNHIIPYAYDDINLKQKHLPPMSQSSDGHTHLFGTDSLGRDVAAGLVHAIRLAIILCLVATIIALIIGVLAALLSSVHTVFDIGVRWYTWLLTMFLIWYGYYLLYYALFSSSLLFMMGTVVLVAFGVLTLVQSQRRKQLILDDGVLLITMLFRALPALLILIVIAGMQVKMTYIKLAVLLGVFIWPSYYKLLRGEFMRIANEPFLHSAKAAGVSHLGLYLRHILPNSIVPIIAYVCFSMVAIIISEATLSFLGIGLSAEEVSLGSMIKSSRGHLEQWWLVLFPGLVLLVLLVCLNTIGSHFAKANK